MSRKMKVDPKSGRQYDPVAAANAHVLQSRQAPQADHDADYQAFEKLIAERVAAARGPLFTTDTEGLFDAYLAGIPGETWVVKANLAGLDSPEKAVQEIHQHSGPRQHYNCNCCRRFIERYGALVSINVDGVTYPLLWAEQLGDEQRVPFFVESMRAMTRLVARAKVTGVFVNSEATWGTPSNVSVSEKYKGTRWTHLHGTPSGELTNRYHRLTATADQAMAELKQDYILLKKTLAEIPMEAAVQAVRVLESDEVSRAEKVMGPARWFLDLHQQLATIENGRRYGSKSGTGRKQDNLIWLAVATAPPGFCHVKNGALGQLMDWIIRGQDFRMMQRKWAAMMHPLQYQRPTTAPTDGQIDAANKVIEKLEAEGALARRYCRLDEVTALWKPHVGWDYDCASLEEKLAGLRETARDPLPPGKDGGVFGGWLADEIRKTEKELADKKSGGAFDHLRKKQPGVKAVELPPKTMTWKEFRNGPLAYGAHTLEVLLTGGSQPFYGLVTAVNPDAPPMLQWDGLKEDLPMANQLLAGSGPTTPLPRNPVSWYFWANGSKAVEWGLYSPTGLAGGTHSAYQWFQKVDAVMLKPCHWQREFAHQGGGIFFAIGAARDSRTPGGGYFPETLRSEWHGIRKVIEEHSRQSKLEPLTEGVLGGNGIALTEQSTLTVRVDGGDIYVLSL